MKHKTDIWFGINIHKKNVYEDNINKSYSFKTKKELNDFLIGN